MKKVIINADDFGLDELQNAAVLKGYQAGNLNYASLVVNTDGFCGAVENVISKCPHLNLGIHLNIVEGRALTNCPKLTDACGRFNRGYLYLLVNQFDKELLIQIENEFCAQIEAALNAGVKLTRIDSHVHVHSIFEIFNITCKLAKKYNIEYVRTQFEYPYLVFPKCLSFTFIVNLIKIAVLNLSTVLNRKTINKYKLKTNDSILGVGYTSMMDKQTVLEGIKHSKGSLVEIVIHPKLTDENAQNEEYLITQDGDLNAKRLNNM